MKFYVQADNELLPRAYNVHLLSDKNRYRLEKIVAWSMIIGGCAMTAVGTVMLIQELKNGSGITEE